MHDSVELDRLEAAVAERGSGAYVLTVSNDGRPHAVYLPVTWDAGRLVVDVGNSTAANAKARPEISLLFPVRNAGDYSFFVDGRAVVESRDGVNRLHLTPSRAASMVRETCGIPRRISPNRRLSQRSSRTMSSVQRAVSLFGALVYLGWMVRRAAVSSTGRQSAPHDEAGSGAGP